MEPKNLNEEINILELSSKIFKSSVKGLKQYTRFFFVNFHLFLISSVMIYLLSLSITNFALKPTYTSELIVKTNFISTKECEYVIRVLNGYIENKNSAYLARNGFKLSHQELKSITIDEITTAKDSLERFIHIKVKVNTNKVFPLIENELLYYLENEPYVSKIINKQINLIQSKYDETLKSIKDLHEKSQLSSLKNTSIDNNLNLAYIDETAIITQRLKLSHIKAALENQLEEPKNFSVIGHLVPHNKVDISTIDIFKKLFTFLNFLLFIILFSFRNKTKLIIA